MAEVSKEDLQRNFVCPVKVQDAERSKYNESRYTHLSKEITITCRRYDTLLNCTFEVADVVRTLTVPFATVDIPARRIELRSLFVLSFILIRDGFLEAWKPQNPRKFRKFREFREFREFRSLKLSDRVLRI